MTKSVFWMSQPALSTIQSYSCPVTDSTLPCLVTSTLICLMPWLPVISSKRELLGGGSYPVKSVMAFAQ